MIKHFAWNKFGQVFWVLFFFLFFFFLWFVSGKMVNGNGGDKKKNILKVNNDFEKSKQ